jgi:hypothetical protein
MLLKTWPHVILCYITYEECVRQQPQKQVSIRDSDKFIDAWSFIHSSQYGMNLLESIFCTKHSVNKENVN